MNITYIKRTMYAALGCLVFFLMAGAANANVCPAVGAATDCGVQINILAQSGGVATSAATLPGPAGNGNPYDGVEDTLVGITNMTSGTVNSINLTSTSGAFFFDGDGPCAAPYSVASSCGATGYEGAGAVTFSNITATSMTVNFTGGLAAGASTWFALEGSPQTIITGSGAPEPGSLLLLGTGLLGLALFVRRSL